jgi:hypothetical protein
MLAHFFKYAVDVCRSHDLVPFVYKKIHLDGALENVDPSWAYRPNVRFTSLSRSRHAGRASQAEWLASVRDARRSQQSKARLPSVKKHPQKNQKAGR